MADGTGDPPNRPNNDTAFRLDQILSQLEGGVEFEPALREVMVRVALDAAIAYEALTWREVDEGWVKTLITDMNALRERGE